ncbi:hypothetical protein [uncultured Nostoc sp.]|uniref:hypothetical protein n=1 Tax=uncultured Nostoc sp. TaxID=340711 RepID=UPI0035CC9845
MNTAAHEVALDYTNTAQTEKTEEISPTALDEQYDTATIMGGLYGDRIIGLKGAFEPTWADRLGEDIEILLEEALARPVYSLGNVGYKSNS